MNVQEIKNAIHGALLLLRNDPDAMSKFNLSFDGFWRSFQAAMIAIPFELALTLFRSNLSVEVQPSTSMMFLEALTYMMGWVVFPLLAIVTTRYFGLQKNYVAYVVVGNWVHLVQVALVAIFLLIFGVEIVASGVWMFVLIATLIYDWIATKRPLQTTTGIAAGLVILNAVVILFVQSTMASLFLSGG